MRYGAVLWVRCERCRILTGGRIKTAVSWVRYEKSHSVK